MSRAERHEILLHIRAASEAVGLDIVHPFNLAVCDWTALGVGAACLERVRSDGLGIVLGNTRELWPRFLRACREDPALAHEAHPLDRYVAERVRSLVARSTTRATRLFFTHEVEPSPFPMQRLAEQAGLSTLGPSHLAIHPLHGPWFGLRALVAVDIEGPPSPSPRSLQSPCQSCSAPCVPALARALKLSGSPLSGSSIARHASEWIAVRDACPVGRASRYGEEQLGYHYAPASWKLTQGS